MIEWIPGLKADKFSSPNLINLISIQAEAEVTDSFWVMTAIEEVIDKGPVTGIEEDILLDPNPEDIIL